MLPSYYEFQNPTKIISGFRALENLPYELKMLNAKKPLLITDQGIIKAGLLKNIKNSFNESDITFILFDKVPQDSSHATVRNLSEIYKSTKCDSIIAVGGGSVIDTAKALNILITENTTDLLQFEGSDILTKPMKPLIVIPTTVGTGSEVTGVAVIKDKKRNAKVSFASQFLIPKVAILDPRMSITLPKQIIASTGMDALTHAIESFICLQKNPVSDAFAWAAIKLISQNLIKAIKDPKNHKYRFSLANGACLAGIGLSNSIAGIIHSLGHAVGGVCGVPHGVAMSIFLPYGLEYNYDRVKEYIAELLLPLVGSEVYVNTSSENRAHKTIEYIRELQNELFKLTELPRTLSEAGVPRDKFEKIARIAIDDGSVAFNPVELEFEDALKILKLAY